MMHHDSNVTTGVVFTRDGYATVTMIAMMVQTKGIVSTVSQGAFCNSVYV